MNRTNMEINPSDEDSQAIYRTLSSLVVPRPIGWISTRSVDGVDNLGPYSYFNAVASDPPVVMFSADSADDGGLKDSPQNAIDTGEFVWNLVTKDLASAMNETGTALGSDQSEFKFAGLDRAESITVEAPRVADAAAAFECSLRESLQIGRYTLVFGDVEHIHVDDELLTEGQVDSRKVDAVGRLGGPYYTGVDRLDLER